MRLPDGLGRLATAAASAVVVVTAAAVVAVAAVIAAVVVVTTAAAAVATAIAATAAVAAVVTAIVATAVATGVAIVGRGGARHAHLDGVGEGLRNHEGFAAGHHPLAGFANRAADRDLLLNRNALVAVDGRLALTLHGGADLAGAGALLLRVLAHLDRAVFRDATTIHDRVAVRLLHLNRAANLVAAAGARINAALGLVTAHAAGGLHGLRFADFTSHLTIFSDHVRNANAVGVWLIDPHVLANGVASGFGNANALVAAHVADFLHLARNVFANFSLHLACLADTAGAGADFVHPVVGLAGLAATAVATVIAAAVAAVVAAAAAVTRAARIA